jgi:hypothetical protein
MYTFVIFSPASVPIAESPKTLTDGPSIAPAIGLMTLCDLTFSNQNALALPRLHQVTKTIQVAI